MPNIFSVNFNLLADYLLPVRLRNAVMRAWVKVLVKPVNTVYTQFTTNRNANLYFLSHNSQVCYLQAALNDMFDPVDRGIYISDGVYYDPIYLYRRIEGKPVYLSQRSEVGSTPYDSPQWLYTRGEVNSLTVPFIVNVPVAVIFDTNRMKALVDSLKLPGKNYSIVTF